jgi:hypothetical protein
MSFEPLASLFASLFHVDFNAALSLFFSCLLQGLSPVTAAIDAFKEFLDRSKSTFVFDILDEKEAWASLEKQETNTEVCWATSVLPAL